MVKYECTICDYSTSNKADHIKHNNTKKHIKKMNNAIIIQNNDNNRIHMDPIWIPYGSHMDHKKNDICEKNYMCNYCNNKFSGANNLARHKKACSVKSNMDKEYELKLIEMQNKIDSLEKDVVHKDREMNCYKTMLMEAGGLVKKSVSALTYSVKNYNDAPALQTITMQDIGNFKGTSDKIVEDVLSAYKHKTLGVYLGDIILHICKKDDPSAQSIWNTDDNRLTYLIKELFNNKSSNWIVDKKGIKTKTYLIDPLLSYIKESIISYQKNFIIPDLNNNSVELEFILDNNKKIISIINDIDDGIVSKDILKHISSHLKFSNKTIE